MSLFGIVTAAQDAKGQVVSQQAVDAVRDSILTPKLAQEPKSELQKSGTTPPTENLDIQAKKTRLFRQYYRQVEEKERRVFNRRALFLVGGIVIGFMAYKEWKELTRDRRNSSADSGGNIQTNRKRNTPRRKQRVSRRNAAGTKGTGDA